jgi:amino acid adenylation domain-containing protein
MAGPIGLTEADLDSGIPDRFARILRQIPGDSTAYSDALGILTYGELDRWSGRLSNLLRSRWGTGTADRQKPVALLIPHGREVYPATLGVLKSGHFYLPLDPELGPAALRDIMEDCPAPVVVATRACAALARSLVPETGHAELWWLDDLPAPPEVPREPLEAGPNLLAAVLFSSGSTGKPRGILQTHGQFLLSVLRMDRDGGYRGGRISFLTSFSQSFATANLFGSMLTGSTAVGGILRRTNAGQLGRWLAEQRVTHLSCPPAIFRSLGALDEGPPLTDLLTVRTGMEPVSHADVDALSNKLPPGGRMIFILGATECGSIARFLVDTGQAWEGAVTPAGYGDPLGQIIIVDEQGRSLPPETLGEIVVRGRFMSPGYWNRPSETAANFRNDPEAPGKRVYFTGDRGLLHATGLLELRGRMDFMVKIRGYRVEPLAIESTLKAHPAVSEAVVIPFQGTSGNARLAAYCVLRPGFPASSSDLRDHMEGSLAPYQIPSRFIFLKALPYSAAGKVDRKALPPPGSARPELRSAFVPPRSDEEHALADLWSELLGLDEVGLDDDFYQLGGDSLSALEMTYLVERRYGRPIPPEFYDVPNLRTLIGLMKGAQEVTTGVFTTDHPETTAPPKTSHDLGLTFSAPVRILYLVFSLLYRMAARVGLGSTFYLAYARLVAWGCRLPLRGLGRFAELARLYETLSSVVSPRADHRSVARHAVLIRILHRTWGPLLKRLRPEDLEGVSSIEGCEHLLQLRRSGRPVIGVSYHSQIYRLEGVLFRRLGIPSVGIFPSNNLTASRDVRAAWNTRILKKAEAALRRGHVVRIYPDGERGTRSVSRPFFGLPRDFYPGFAELAAREQASVVPMSLTLDRGGRVTLTIGPAFQEAVASNHVHRVDEIQGHYVEYLESQWRNHTANVRPEDAKRFLAERRT